MEKIKGYKTAVAKVRKMVREDDGWMTPTNDEPRETDFGSWFQEEIDGWEQTDHFALNYGSTMAHMAHDLAVKNGFEGEWWIDIWQNLKDEFWEAWAEKHNADKFWSENICGVRS